jgi:hypothetical protein
MRSSMIFMQAISRREHDVVKIDVAQETTITETDRARDQERTVRSIFATGQHQYQSQFDRQVGFTLC